MQNKEVCSYIVVDLNGKIGKRLTKITGNIKAIRYLMQGTSMAIQKRNAAWIISARPSNEELDSVFYLSTIFVLLNKILSYLKKVIDK